MSPSSTIAASLARRTKPLRSISSTPVRMRRMIRPLTSLRLATSAARRLATAWDSRICRPSGLLTVAMAKKLTENNSNSANGRSATVTSSVFHRYSPTNAEEADDATDIDTGDGSGMAAARTGASDIHDKPGDRLGGGQ